MRVAEDNREVVDENNFFYEPALTNPFTLKPEGGNDL